MPPTRISQREARCLKRRVCELEEQERARRRSWAQDWPDGISIATAKWEPNDQVPVAVRTARRLNHAVVAMTDDTGRVSFIALPLAGETRG